MGNIISWLFHLVFGSNKDIVRSDAGPNVSAAAQSGSQITAPVFTNNTITGNVNIIHNTPNSNGPLSKTTQTSATSFLKYKERICSEYQCVTEYNSQSGEQVLLSERYTQPLILQRHRGQKEREEEIRSRGESFQKVLSARSSDDSVHLNSLFDPDGHGIHPRAVILQGNSGNGKSFTAQKIMLDWASGDLYKERFDVVFHLKCKEINIYGIKSLVEILSCSCSLTSDQISQVLQHSPEKMLFIIDGFDELRLTQDINDMSPHTDLLQKAPADVILCDLLRGRILPESFLLVTSRSTATDTLSNPAGNPFLCKFLFKRRIHQETMFSFMHLSFQEFFTALYYVLLDEKESQRKLTQLFSIDENSRDFYSRRSRFSAVVQFAFGLLNKDVRRTLEEHGLFVHSKTQTHLKEWILEMGQNTYSDKVRFYLHCLYELHEEDFVKKAMETWKIIDAYDAVISRTDVWVLLYCSQCCQCIEELDLSGCRLSSENFRMILPVYHKFKKVNKLNVEVSTDSDRDLDELMYALIRGQTLRSQSIVVLFTFEDCSLELTINEEISIWISSPFLESLTLTFQCREPINIEWNKLIQIIHQEDSNAVLDSRCLSKMWTVWILQIIHNCSSLTELKLSLKVSSDSDLDLDELINTLTRGQTLRSLSIDVDLQFTMFDYCSLHLSIDKGISICIDTSASLESLTLTFQCREPINFEWNKLMQIIHQEDPDALMSVLCSFSELKKMKITLDCLNKMWCHWILQIIQNCSSLTELKVYADFLLEKGIQILQKSHTRPACSVTFEGYICNNQSQKRKRDEDCDLSCNQEVKIHLSSSGFSMETL